MERRLLLAIVLTFVVLTVYQWLVPMPQQPPAQRPPVSSPAPAPAQPPAATPEQPSAAAPAPTTGAQAVETVHADTAERTITVDNGVVRAVFSNRGATLAAWELTGYQGPDGRPVDLVPHDVPPNQPKPFSFKLEDADKTSRVNAALFAVAAERAAGDIPANLDARSSPVTLSFEYQDAAGLHVQKEFRLEPNSYVVTLTANVTDGGRAINPTIQWGPGLGDVLAMGGGGAFMPVRKSEAIFSVAGDVERIAGADLVETSRYRGVYEFAGVDTHYFISVAVKPGSAELEYSPLSIPAAGAQPPISRDYVGYDIRFQSPPGGSSSARFFVGPKHFETLRRADPDLVRAIWFGMFAFLSVPLLSALNWVNGFVGR
jgi:YidC/Oxa1 family membrane protein insertase